MGAGVVAMAQGSGRHVVARVRVALLFVLTGALLALAAALPAAAQLSHNAVVRETERAVPAGPAYAAPEPSTLGGSFEMTDHTGKLVTDKSYQGKYLLIYFGFIGCREACPVGLEHMLHTLDALGTDQERIQPLFVDFSMEKPDLKGLAQFVSNFHPRLVGLAGTRKQTWDMLRKFKVRREYGHASYGMKETGPRIDHTTYLYLVGPDGKARAYFYHSLPPEEMAATIRRHLPTAPG